MKSALTLLACALLSALPVQAQNAAAEREAVRQAILDYVEAIYDIAPERIARSVHPTLAKRGFQIPRDSTRYHEYPMTYAQLVEVAKSFNSRRTLKADAPKRIDIFEVLDQTASAKLTAVWGIDYFHLAKYDGKWMIVNVLWQAPPKPATPSGDQNDSSDDPADDAEQLPQPERVQPGVISTERNEAFPAIDPVDGSLWYSVYADNFDRQTIMRAARSGNGWSAPAAVAFSGQWGDRAPRFSPDGQRLYISSNRPTPNNAAGGDFNLWMLRRSSNGWGEPKLLPDPVNSTGARDYHSSETKAGDLYVASTRPGGAGRGDIYHFKRSGETFTAGATLGATINDAFSQPDLLVSPDGSWMILVVTEHSQGLGGDDLFVSRFDNGKWSALKHLPAPINSNEYEYGPSLSPDGLTLYFTSHRGGNADVYRVPLAALGLKVTK